MSPLTTRKGASPSPAADAAGGLERGGLGRVADVQTKGAAVAERGFDHLAEVRVVDDDLVDAGGRQPAQMMNDQRRPARRQ